MKNKITIIDLINKIANGKEIPKKFRYKGETYIYRTYTFEDGDIMTGYGFEDGGWLNIWRDNLNDEVEILDNEDEEKKIPEKLPYYSMEKIQKAKNKDEWREERITLLEKRVNDLHIKMNDLLDYLKSKGDE